MIFSDSESPWSTLSTYICISCNYRTIASHILKITEHMPFLTVLIAYFVWPN
jgi:hypothetical protein